MTTTSAGLAERLMKAADRVENRLPYYADLFREAAHAVTDLGLAAQLHKEAYERLNQALEVAAFDDYQREVDLHISLKYFLGLPKARAYVNACIAEWIKRYNHE